MSNGLVRATAKEALGEDLVASSRLAVQEYGASQPRITVKPQDSVVELNSKISFFCQGAGDPFPSVTWKRNDRVVSQARYVVESGSDGYSALRIDPVRDRDNNTEISCVVSNAHGSETALAKLVVLSAEHLPPGFPRIIDDPKLRAVEKGSSETMTCNVRGDPAPAVLWLKNFLPVDMKNRRYSVSTIGNPGSLVIQRSAEEDEGKYECVARNSRGVVHSRSAHLYVKVRRVPPNFSIPPHRKYPVMPGGSVNLTCVAFGHPMPRVFWRKGVNNLEDPAQSPYGRNVLLLNDVQKTENYTCVAFSNLGNIEAVTTVEVKSLPYPPPNLRVVKHTANSVTLQWDSVSVLSDDLVEHYIVEYRPKYSEGSDFTESEITKDNSMTVTDLEPHTQYEFQVRTASKNGKSKPSWPVEVTTGEALPESPPKNVHSRALSSTSIIVQWEPPDVPNGVITNYLVYYWLNPADPLEMWDKKEAGVHHVTTINELRQDVVYTIRVRAVNSVGPGPLSIPVSVITHPRMPGQPQNLKATAMEADHILLSWEAPLFSGDLTAYVIKYNSTAKDLMQLEVSSSKLQTTVTGLKPNTDYTFEVYAKSDRGLSVPSLAVVQKTNPLVPTGAPQGVLVEALSSHELRVIWEPPPKNEQHGLITEYKITWEAEADSVGNGDYGDNERAGSVVQVADKQRSVVIDGLRPYTVHKVSVAAGTVKGFGPPSPPVMAKTFDDGLAFQKKNNVPGAPRNLKLSLVNVSSVAVKWDEPASKNGELVGYSVYVEELDSEGRPVYQGVIRPAQRTTVDVREAVVHDLKINRNYSFRVNAYNRKGDGYFVKAKTIFIPPIPPSEPRNVHADLMYHQPPLKLVLKWDEPEKTYGIPVLRYRLKYRVAGAHAEEFETLYLNETGTTVEPLKYGRTYEFYVAAENSKGVGKESLFTVQTPTGVPDSPPMGIRYQFDPKAKTLQFMWLSPPTSDHNGEIKRYQTRLTLPSGSDSITSEVSENTITYQKVEPDTKYQFSVRAGTVKGFGPWSDPVMAQARFGPTVGDLLVKNVSVQVMSDRSALVSWEPSTDQRVSGYKVQYSSPIGDGSWQETQVARASAHNALVVDLISNATYTFCSVSECSDSVVEVIRPRFVVRGLRDDQVHSSYVSLHWRYDDAKEAASFYVKYHGKKKYRTQSDEWKELSIDGLMVETDKTTVNITNLRPYTNYTFEVGVVWSNGTVTRHFHPVALNVTTKRAAPPFVTAPKIIEALNSREVRISLEPATEEYGPVRYYWLVVVPANLSRMPYEVQQKELLRTHTHHLAPDDVYVAALLSRGDILNLKNGLFTLGDGLRYGGFRNLPLNNKLQYKTFLRAFLEEPDLSESSANQIHASSMYSGKFKTLVPYGGLPKLGSSNLWLVGPIVAILVVGLIICTICVFLLRRNRKKNFHDKTGSLNKTVLSAVDPSETSKLLKDPYGGPGAMTNGVHSFDTTKSSDTFYRNAAAPMEMQNFYYPQPPPTVASSMPHPPIPIVELAVHIERLRMNDNQLFSQEYESIETGQHFTWENSNLEYNKPKNRYANVVAYDHSRVVLSQIDDVPGSDYINASYIDGYRKPKAYIATQGPLSDTFADFWRMVWEENSATVVMLTKLEERTRIKCDQYWPTRGSVTYGTIVVTFKETTEFAHYVLRVFDISKANQSGVREIRQLQFTSWPDHGVPEHPTPFLIFLKRVKAINPPEAGPIIVHCSAGVGRSGAFIVVDCMLDRLHYENTVDIYGCVTAIRSQRSYMVQTEEQYIFIHDAVLDVVQSGYTEVPVPKLPLHIESLMQFQPLENVTGMALEFRRQSSLKLPNAKFFAANLPCNKLKNRLGTVLPYDSTRVCLSPLGNVEGSDYINASFIDGYKKKRMYIATQAPLPDTVEDFWRMLWEQNSTIIVMLTQLREFGREICHLYWPGEQSQRCGMFLVEPVAEYNMPQYMPQYILREFKLTDIRSGQSKLIRHFQYTDWPCQGVPKSSENLVDFIGQIHKTREQFGQDGPITVHCSTGVGRTGMFIALSIILERIRYEGVVDVFTVVKLLRLQRANMVQLEEQYQFLYQVALDYLSSFDYAVQTYE